MLLFLRLFGEHIGPLGVSVAGAAFHNTGQILVAWALLKSRAVLLYLPPLLLIAIFTGAVIGLIARRLRPYLAAYMGRHDQ
jgi:uncharacterized membrane protein